MAKKQVTNAAIRTAVADYMASEGCSCCEDTKSHTQAAARLAELLNVPMYQDKSGYDFTRFKTKVKS